MIELTNLDTSILPEDQMGSCRAHCNLLHSGIKAIPGFSDFIGGDVL